MFTRIARRVKRMTASQAFRSSIPVSLAPIRAISAPPAAPLSTCHECINLRPLHKFFTRRGRESAGVQTAYRTAEDGCHLTSASSLLAAKHEGRTLVLPRTRSASVSPSYAFLLGLVESPPPLMALARPPPPDVLLGSVA